MTRQEFAEKWGYQSGLGYGSAQFDCKASLLKDLDMLIADEVKNLTLPQVMPSVCIRCGKPIELVDNIHCKQCQSETSEAKAN